LGQKGKVPEEAQRLRCPEAQRPRRLKIPMAQRPRSPDAQSPQGPNRPKRPGGTRGPEAKGPDVQRPRALQALMSTSTEGHRAPKA
jgi:hypothetical protein